MRVAQHVARWGDFAGILLVLAGLVGYLWTEGALARLGRQASAPGGTTYGAVARADTLATTSHVALGLAALGIAVLVVTALVQRRERRRRMLQQRAS